MEATYKIGIIGIGIVGSCLKKYFERNNYQLFLYDNNLNIGSIDEVNKADYVYICVPTPYIKKTGCDISIVKEVISQLTEKKVVIIKSTVIPGTTEKLQKQYPDHKILFNPEFLTESTADEDFNQPEQQIIGYTYESHRIAKDIINQLPKASFEKIIPATAAELTKYVTNSWFAIKVSYANQIYDLCKKLDINYENIHDSIIANVMFGKNHFEIFHKGYRGYGGKCIKKDSKAFIIFCKNNNLDPTIISSADKYNDKILTIN